MNDFRSRKENIVDNLAEQVLNLRELVKDIKSQMVETHNKLCVMDYWECHEELHFEIGALEEARAAVSKAADQLDLLHYAHQETLRGLKGKVAKKLNNRLGEKYERI